MLSIRLGLPIVGGQLPAAARALGCPTLVSANALAIYRGAGTEREFTRFRVTLDDLAGLDVALDSAGFVAHAKYRGFLWDVGAYVGLAGAFPWAWWAQMDACCEPEIASNADAVRFRQAAKMFAQEDSWRAARSRQRRHATAAHGFGVHGVHR